MNVIMLLIIHNDAYILVKGTITITSEEAGAEHDKDMKKS